MSKRHNPLILLRFVTSGLLLLALANSPASSIATSIYGYSSPNVLTGRLDDQYLIRFEKILSEAGAISLSSTGGKAEIALDIADQIKNKKEWRITIEGVCLSSCAEILLPAASQFANLSFRGLPIIGFHQNSEIFRLVLSDGSQSAFENCINGLNDRFLRFAREVGRNKKSFEMQAIAVAAVPKSGIVSTDCSSSFVRLNRKYWFPTSEQLKSIFAIDVPGRVCADSLTCIQKVLTVIGNDGEKFLVGNKEFTITRQKNILTISISEHQVVLDILEKE